MDISELVPTKGHSIIRVEKKPTEANGLILAGESLNSAPVIGTVIRASDGSAYSEGTEVVFRKYAIDTLTWVNENGEEEILYILNNEEILASIINNKNKHANNKSQIEQRQEARREESSDKESREEGDQEVNKHV
jgi:hypothetical protein